MGEGSWAQSLFTAMTFADWVTMVLASWAGLKVYQGRPHRIIASGRRRHLGSLLDKAHIGQRTRVVLDSHEHSPAHEISWLADTLEIPGSKGLEFAATPQLLSSLAQAYEAYAAWIERGILFGANAAPIVEREVDLAQRVAAHLHAAAGRERWEGRELATLRVEHRGLCLELFGRVGPAAAENAEPDFAARDLDVSYRRHRKVAPALAQERGALPPVPVGGSTVRVDAIPGVTAEEVRAVHTELLSEHYFDGILPRLVDWRVERDPRSGRQSMHLSLAECTYAGVVLDHYPHKLTSAGAPPRPVTGSRVGLLTLSAVLLTACDHLVFVRRSPLSHTHPRKFTSAINGNLELTARRGLARDLDASGFPDPMVALAREGREELGLGLSPADISLTAVGRFSVPEELNTNVLTGLAVVDLDLTGLLLSMRHADPVEGAWELGGSVLAVPYPRTDARVEEVIAWLTGSDELSPHATLAGLGALALHSNMPDVFARAGTSAGALQMIRRPRDTRELPTL